MQEASMAIVQDDEILLRASVTRSPMVRFVDRTQSYQVEVLVPELDLGGKLTEGAAFPKLIARREDKSQAQADTALVQAEGKRSGTPRSVSSWKRAWSSPSLLFLQAFPPLPRLARTRCCMCGLNPVWAAVAVLRAVPARVAVPVLQRAAEPLTPWN
jgi:hypothetical protein